MEPASPHRIALLDLARSAALVGMVAFHLSYDLLMFGLLPPSYAGTAAFYYHARIVAGAFIFLAGLGLFLAHPVAIDWRKFARRLVKIVAAAALVTQATRVALPEAYVFFGILHAIALFSLLGLGFLRLPAWAILATGIAVFFAGDFLQSTAFDAPLLKFLGLSTTPAYTVDFEPVFPWFGVFLIGAAIGKLGGGIWRRLALWPANRTPLLRALSWPGQHSLAIYLIHQPVLLGLVWAIAQLRQ